MCTHWWLEKYCVFCSVVKVAVISYVLGMSCRFLGKLPRKLHLRCSIVSLLILPSSTIPTIMSSHGHKGRSSPLSILGPLPFKALKIRAKVLNLTQFSKELLQSWINRSVSCLSPTSTSHVFLLGCKCLKPHLTWPRNHGKDLYLKCLLIQFGWPVKMDRVSSVIKNIYHVTLKT